MKIKLDHHSPIPLYVQIEEQLRKEIQKPDYQNGKKLPNESILANQLGISRSTLRQALNMLVQEELLIRKQGVGTVVAHKSVTSNANNWLSFSQEMEALGMKIRNYQLTVNWVVPDKALCHFFDIEENAKVLKLERLRGDIERPFVYFVSYFNPRIGLTLDEDFTLPLYDILAKNNAIAKLSKEEVSAQPADNLIAQKLLIEEHSPILKRIRHVFDPGGRAIEWNAGYYIADSFVYTVESERNI